MITQSAYALQEVKDLPTAARIVIKFLEKIEHGQLRLTLPSGVQLDFGSGQLQADLQVHNLAVFTRCLSGGDIAFGQAYMDGEVDTSDLTRLLTLFVHNRRALEKAFYGSKFGILLDKLLHFFRRNTKAQARKNIAAHYDLGNDFYALWLEQSWTYSAAIFDAPFESIQQDDAQLTAAQHRKYDRAIDALALPAQAKLLEIGCGWGGLAERAVMRGHQVKGLTLSSEQLTFAKNRLSAAVQAQQVNFALQDYRDEGLVTAEQYDGIVSIEMFEAVGEQYWDSYFACIARNLKQGGRACVQSITIDEALFEQYRTNTDFIQRYIFPGGMLPSKERFIAAAQKHGLRCVDSFAFGHDYARTLAVWHKAFIAAKDAVIAGGKDLRFCRMWAFYLAYCEAGFTQGSIDVVQFTLEK